MGLGVGVGKGVEVGDGVGLGSGAWILGVLNGVVVAGTSRGDFFSVGVAVGTNVGVFGAVSGDGVAPTTPDSVGNCGDIGDIVVASLVQAMDKSRIKDATIPLNTVATPLGRLHNRPQR